DVVRRVGPDRCGSVLDQVAEPLIEVRRAGGHRPRQTRVLEPRLPAKGVLWHEVRVAVHETGRERLVEARLLEPRPEGSDGPTALPDASGQARPVCGIGAEALIVLQARAEDQCDGPL